LQRASIEQLHPAVSRAHRTATSRGLVGAEPQRLHSNAQTGSRRVKKFRDERAEGERLHALRLTAR